MDSQMKKGMIEVVVLSSLIKEESYGYKILKDISKVVDMSESTLYPILRRLEKGLCLTTYSKEYEGRLRKYYAITDLGKQTVGKFIEEWKNVIKVYNYIHESYE